MNILILPGHQKRFRASCEPFQVATWAPGAIPHPQAHLQVAFHDKSRDKIGMAIFGAFLEFLVDGLPREYYTIYVSNLGVVTRVTWSLVATWRSKL